MREFLAVIFALFLCSCNMGQGGGTPVLEPEAKPPFGWRSAGLMPNLDSLSKWGTGFIEITHSKDYIFVMDSRVSNLQTLKPTAYRIFMSRQGSEKWEEMPLPIELKAFDIYGDDSGLYVGSYGNGQIWHYEPNSKEWKNIYSMQLTENQRFNVYAITKFEGKLLASVAGFKDLSDATNSSVGLILHRQPDGTWKNIAPPDSLEIYVVGHRVPLHFTSAREWRGKLFVVSAECGVWAYDNVSWRQLPHPPNYREERDDRPYAIELHKDRLYIGQYSYGGVQEVQEDYSRVQVDSNFATNGSYSKRTPIYVKTLISTGENLIVAGENSGLPKVYMGDKGEPKGWRRLGYGSWCPPGKFRCIALTTYGLDIAGDTLYAAAWEGVFKFPLSDLDSAIAGEKSYYEED
jgi:hypothetical protein